MIKFFSFLSVVLMTAPVYAAVNIPLTVNLSETVTVTGTPRIAVDVGGTTRYATYSSGTGTNALTFTLSPQTGDVDLDGVTVSSPIDLNGGTITDIKGNDATLTFTPPSTTNVKVNYPSLGMDFVYDADGRYTLNGTVYNDLTSFLSATGGTFTRASIGTYFDSTGTLQTAASGIPRFDYDPVTHAAKGILIEESRVNLAKYTSQFDTGWSKTNISISPNTLTAPDGSMTADKIVEMATTGSHVVFQNTGTGILSSPYTISAFLKAGERDKGAITFMGYTNWQGGTPEITFDLSTGTIVTTGTTTRSSIKDVGNGWYYITLSSVMTTAAAVTPAFTIRDLSNNPSYTGDGSSGYYIWGAQVEQGSFPTSYIPTTTSTVTRAADTLVINNLSPWVGAYGGSFTLRTSTFGSRTAWGYVQLWDGSTSNRIGIINVGGVLSGNVNVSSVNQAAIGAAPPSGTFNASLSYLENNITLALGGHIYNDTSALLPTVTQLKMGGSSGGGTELNGWIGSFKYYPAHVTDTQLQLLTQ